MPQLNSDQIVMRIIHIAISATSLLLFTAACATESAVPPTSTLAPEPVVAATETPPPTEPPAPTKKPAVATAPERDLDIVTLLPFDGIPAIDNPQFFPDIDTANNYYNDGELVLGVEIDGDARAYSVPLLSSHEIVNDIVGGKPIAVTW